MELAKVIKKFNSVSLKSKLQRGTLVRPKKRLIDNKLSIVILTAMLSLPAFGQVILDVELANGSDKELLRKEQLLTVLAKYDTSKWYFTDKITINEKARTPYSHPRLTLTTSKYTRGISLLTSYLHEQIHWFEDEHPQQTKNVIAQLKKLYPQVPSKPPAGARNESSTYLHLMVCLLEFDALSELVGVEKARDVLENNGQYFYRWIYKTVLSDADKIRTILKSNNLYIN